MIKRNSSQITLWVGTILMLAVSAMASTVDPWTWTQTGTLIVGRSCHTATLLPNGKVLVAGGAATVCSFQRELYDPATGTWTQTGDLNIARSYHTATLLPNGKVLVAGGTSSSYLFKRSCTIRPAGRGRRPALSTPPELFTRRRCCPMARCWSRGDPTFLLIVIGGAAAALPYYLFKRSCTIRPAGHGRRPAR